jgi:DNA polymerase III subunit epsilon
MKKNRNNFDWKLERPLAIFDIEATGTSPRVDRIVELAIVKIMPDGTRTRHVYRVNPGMPIPPEATAIHKITDADVVNCPLFGAIAQEIRDLLEGCDLGGYNVGRFDIPMLQEEFLRAKMKFDVDDRRVVDAQRIFHRKEPRDLTAALAFYCGEMHLDAHGAVADTDATVRVFEAQFERYADLPRDVVALDAYCNPREANWVDRTGKLKWDGGEVVLNFGQKKGTRLRALVENDKGFINWILRSDFPRDMKDIVEGATKGQWPSPPAAAPEPQE